MPKQMDQLQKFYNSITRDGVKIKPTVPYYGRVSFMVEKGNHVESFSVAHYNDRGSLSLPKDSNTIKLSSSNWVKIGAVYYTKNVDLCSFKRGSAGYRLLTSLFNNLIKLDSNTHYDGKEFCSNTFSPFIKALLSLNNQSTTIKSTITQLPDLNQFTTKQKSSTVALNEQEFHLPSSKTTNYVMEEVKRSNASNGITPKNITNMISIFSYPILHNTNVRRPKISGSNKECMGVLTAGLLVVAIASVVAMATAVTLKYWPWNRTSKVHSRSEGEAPSDSLLNTITLESRGNCIN